MVLRHLKRSPALLCALAAPLLYAAATLAALQLAAHPTELEDPVLLHRLDREIAQARQVTLSITLILAVEAALLAALGGRLNRRSTAGGLVLCTATSVVYLLTLALAVLATYAIVLYPAGDFDLGLVFPGWYFPALIILGLMALTGLTVWLSVAVRSASVS
ncbi:hypothetical protein AB0H88_27640 [Nonomuraea sp. NPDC050680]|uniref:hypothetical protein n=1 Tax=Nonomuraea sp. NPDC050680 TaxID=3154630 RepID=UPI0033F3E690